MSASESQFVEDKVRAFRQKYPAKSGWFVCRGTYMQGMEYLPALLREQGVKLEEDGWVHIALYEGQRATRIDLRQAPFVTRGPGISDSDWFGTIRFRWKGIPVVIERGHLEHAQLSPQDVTLIATKKRVVLQGLGEVLRSFWRRIMKGAEHEALVVNGSGFIQLPDLGWSDLILPGEMAAEIRSNVEAFLRAQAHYRKLGLPFRRGFLFVGPPGGGKTTAAKIIMANAKARPLILSLQGDIKDSTIDAAFREAASQPPAILLIEDLDKLVQSKDVSLAHLLNLLDGLETQDGFLTIATSNEPEKIDKALLHRPSRFDRVWHFGLPGQDERRRLLVLRGKEQFSAQAMDEVARASAGMTMAYVQELVVSAMLQALHEGREPQDADLIASVKKLREQFRSTTKATGAIPEPQAMGFACEGEAA